MMNTKYFKSGAILLVLIAAITLSSCVEEDVTSPEEEFVDLEELFEDEDDVLIGGDRDEYGCLGAAGYTWNETELACVREWLPTDVPDRYQSLSRARAEEIAQEFIVELMEEMYPTSHSLELIEIFSSPSSINYFFKYQFLVEDMTVCGYEVRITIKAEDDMAVEAEDLQYCRGELTGCSIKACPTVLEESCDILTDVSVCDDIDLDKGICELNADLTDSGEMGEKVYQPTAEIWCDGGN